MELIDIGANLTHSSFAHDLEEVLLAAQDAGLAHIMLTGTDQESSTAASRFANQRPELFSATAGFHPHVADGVDEAAMAAIAALLEDSKVVAVGETGLDYNRNYSAQPRQREVFEQHLQLASRCRKPLFLHQRDAHQDFLPLLRDYRADIAGAVVHCFTDSAEAMADYLALDLYIGITGWICDERRGKELQSLVREIPSQRLLLETDAPYLLPRSLQPKPKSRRNEPRYLREVLATVARCRDEDETEVARYTSANARELFKLDGQN